MYNIYLFTESLKYLRTLQYLFKKGSKEFKIVDKYFDKIDHHNFRLRDLINCYRLTQVLEKRCFNG